MPKYAVYYVAQVTQEAIVEAKTKKEAIDKVKEVIGDPIKIEGSWEVKGA